ncbi:MAG: GNAT family N-acetyltransferase [Bacteroidota bacterium]
MDITFRTEIQDGDLGWMVYMHGRHYSFGVPFECYVAETLAAFFREFDPEKERIWFAEVEGKVVGTLALKNSEGWAQLRYFLIDPEYRGRGLGRRLMDRWMQAMKAMGYDRAFLLTTDGLEASAHLYGRYGFALTGTKSTDFGVPEHRYEMKV